MTTYQKPLPDISDRNRPFWEGCKNGELKMQKCTECGHIRYPIGPVCTKCLSGDFEWANLSGKGTIFNYIIVHQKYNAAFADDLPYNVIMVQLDEGTRMFSNLVGVENNEIKIGMKVEATFEKATDEIYIPKFRLAQ
jgi:uncharacterized OB-fold protein